MKKTCLKLLVTLVLAIVFSAPSCWAKEKGYCYIVSYSMNGKIAYITPVFVAKVSGATYSEEEFVADVELIRKIEEQFQNYLAGQGMDNADFVTSARVAYRSQAIADKRIADEKKIFTGRGYTVKDANRFKFKN
ncbi:hypothetical protein [uncultured Desulfosarcina sp.]|uniref:hypothetical protein n=1 Tax=uncultured Desulfosarcina sp. TaxID=218289 RepID=UPI0029C8A6EE|nr:hypothetical protein [uncultured Desulfosarcina sp.]